MSALVRAMMRAECPGGAPRRRLFTSAVLAAAAGAVLEMLGFVVFANTATRGLIGRLGSADGIVVLTGGADRRIEEALRLLDGGHARRLLITGINPRTSAHDLRRIAHGENAKFDCCVDLGYDAQDTVGNAEETRAWADRNRYGRLIVVTSSYHMLRSMSELSRVLPDVTLIPYPVVPRFLRDDPWWLNISTTRILIVEYVKLIPSMVRSWATRLARPSEVASGVAPQPQPKRGNTARLDQP